MINNKERQIIPLSRYSNYCDGYGNPGAIGEDYLIGFVQGLGKTSNSSKERISSLAPKIDAFDKAEVDETFIGQINMITVSSFCGPGGLIWGYDLSKPDNLYTPVFGIHRVSYGGLSVPVYSLDPLLYATKQLFGTVNNKRFPLRPGSHVPCAAKSIEHQNQSYLYCTLTLGVASNRGRDACLLMEDVGLALDNSNRTINNLLSTAAESVLWIGENQRVIYKEVFTSTRVLSINDNETGCALVAAPYFTLAQNALPKDCNLFEIGLSRWNDLC